jgi:hypothetical protein
MQPDDTTPPPGSFQASFWAQRARYADTPTDRIATAGKGTKAYPHGEDEKWWLDNGPKMLESYEHWRDTTDYRIWQTPEGIPAIELGLVVDVGAKLPVKMYIDRIFINPLGHLAIVDLKSGARSPASDMQLGFYRVGVLQNLGVRIDQGNYYDARKGVLSDTVSLTRYTPALVGHWMRQFEAAREAGIYIPNLSHWCRSCGVRDYCAAYGGLQSHFDPDYQYIDGGNE